MPYKIKIIGFNRKRGMFSQEIKHYQQLLNPYASLSIIYIKSPPGNHKKELQQREEKLICDKWENNSYPVALSEEGKMYTSTTFAQWLEQRLRFRDNLIFNLGSAYGLSPRVKGKCRDILSFSPLTMPHRLCLVVLVEQLYRAFTILKGHPYHK